MRVLLAQTDQDSLTIFRTALEAEGHEVIVVRSGEQAIRVALEERPDVIVTELVLPIVDGWQVLRVLQAHAALRGVPIVALTSHVQPGGERDAIAAGFTDYLTLPIDPYALVDALEAGERPKEGPPSRSPAAPGESKSSGPRRHRGGITE